jgi:biotin transport system substrate-specific component
MSTTATSAFPPSVGALADSLVPARSFAKDLGWILGGATLTAVMAQVSVPWEPVPFTLQTLAVMLCGAALGARRGALSQLSYLAAGLAGLPVFAGGKMGPSVLVGPTGGYLVAFVAAAFMVGLLAERGWDRKPISMFAVLMVGHLVIWTIGSAWLSSLVGGWGPALSAGVLPFLAGDAVKCLVAVGLLPGAWAFLRSR